GETTIPVGGYLPTGDDDPAEIVRFRGVGQEYPEVNVHPGVLLDVSFTELTRPISIHDLNEIREWVGRIVDHFRPDFS
ncbi:MAG TPA: hypothetical protein VIJ70_02545, partial [Gaiellaceae bacterium]